MPYSGRGLRNAVIGVITVANMEVRLHSADPGAAGTSNRITGGGLGSPTIARFQNDATPGGWTVPANTHASAGQASNTAAVSFGTINTGLGSASHYSLWQGANFILSEALAAPMTLADGSAVSITAGSIILDVNNAA